MRGTKPSLTARHVARTRASLTRPEVPTGDAAAEDRLYRALGRVWLPRGGEAWHRRMERRTAFFDRQTLNAMAAGVPQIVIVAAGYDGRALRFAKPGVRFFEVDHPSTQADKRARLADIGVSPAAATFVPVDLTVDDVVARLADAGHDRHRPSLFIVEGLLGYLPRTVTTGLLEKLRAIAADGSRLAVAFPILPEDLSAAEVLRRRLRGLVVSFVGEPWMTRFGPDEPDRLLMQTGWQVATEEDGRPARYAGRVGVLVAAVPAPRSR